jgi:hypothetical protein
MGKTYANITVANATAGNAILASDFSTVFTNSNNFRTPPSCGVNNSSNQSIANTTNTRLSFSTSALWDTEAPSDPMFASGTPSRITIRTAGLYLITSYVLFDTNGTGTRELIIDKGTSSSITLSIARSAAPIQNLNYANVAVSAVASLAVGDAIQLFVYQASGIALNVLSQTSPMFTATWLGQVS